MHEGEEVKIRNWQKDKEKSRQQKQKNWRYCKARSRKWLRDGKNGKREGEKRRKEKEKGKKTGKWKLNRRKGRNIRKD